MFTGLLALAAALAVSSADADARTVQWQLTAPASRAELSFRFGVSEGRLSRLNPELSPQAVLPAGATVRVFGPEDVPTRSIGWPHKGRLQNGVPLPEGDAWRLRETRRRLYGTPMLVDTLVQAFESYGQAFPDAPPVRVGELSRRKGGELKPHVSHRSGRDVDLGYILLGEDDGETRWRTAKPDTLDAEKTWFLLTALVDSGNVEVIFVSSRIQKMLRTYAVEHVAKEVRARYFLADAPDSTAPVWLRHQKGHRDHMHVRVRCGAGSPRCRSKGVWPK